MDARPVIELIDAAVSRSSGGLVLVGIGGRGGAGKTTLARTVAEAQIVSTDEFWDGEGFDIPRLRREVVDPLAAGRPARFSSYDWAARRLRGSRVVTPEGVVVVEGVCALHRTLRDAYAVRVWVEAPADVRLARGVARDGEDARSTWVDVWMPSEDRYIERDAPIACAHVVVDGTGAPPAAGTGAAMAS
jgi:uridine kinase